MTAARSTSMPAAAWNFLVKKAAFWRHEQWRVDVRDGMDDVGLALAVDAWSRTGRVSVVAASDSKAVTLRSGLTLVAGPAAAGRPSLPLTPALAPVRQLERTLCEIAGRYGSSRRDWVMREMEYPARRSHASSDARASSGGDRPLQCGLDPVRCERHCPQPRARGIEYGVADRRRDRAGDRLAGPPRRLARPSIRSTCDARRTGPSAESDSWPSPSTAPACGPR